MPRRKRRYGFSGILLERKGDAVLIAAVGKGSPGAAAGLRAGDRLVDRDYDVAVIELDADPGARVPLTVSRGGETLKVTVTTADYL